MRLWHQFLIPYLDDKRLLGQHRECCALRGKGWGRKHSTVNYVFDHHISYLIQYHLLVMDECKLRGFHIDDKWLSLDYRGKNLPKFSNGEMNRKIYWDNLNIDAMCEPVDGLYLFDDSCFIYPEHNPKYLLECLENLHSKNAKLINGFRLEEFRLKLMIMGF